MKKTSASCSGSSGGASSSSVGSGISVGNGPTRKAVHAGSCCPLTAARRVLGRKGRDERLKQFLHIPQCGSRNLWMTLAQLGKWLSQVQVWHGPARAIVAPHAGYAYCGATAAFAYKQIDPDRINRVFILGPSHHVCLSGCAVSSCSRYKTPLYDLYVDQRVNQELLATGSFETMDLKIDEAEHSIEMHLPYIAKVMENKMNTFTIVPVLIGSLSSSRQAVYGKIFAKYIADPHNLFIVSSDFCHWGQRFHFCPFEQGSGDHIYKQIESLDKEGMRIIESLDPISFNEYLKHTQNTICGRHPICVMLQAAENFRQMNNHRGDFRFLQYAQSNQCRSPHDTSVSYAAGSLVIRPK